MQLVPDDLPMGQMQSY